MVKLSCSYPQAKDLQVLQVTSQEIHPVENQVLKIAIFAVVFAVQPVVLVAAVSWQLPVVVFVVLLGVVAVVVKPLVESFAVQQPVVVSIPPVVFAFALVVSVVVVFEVQLADELVVLVTNAVVELVAMLPAFAFPFLAVHPLSSVSQPYLHLHLH